MALATIMLVAEELRNSLDIGRFAAAGAGAPENSNSGCANWQVLDGFGLVDHDLLVADMLGDVIPVLVSLVASCAFERLHHQRLAPWPGRRRRSCRSPYSRAARSGCGTCSPSSRPAPCFHSTPRRGGGFLLGGEERTDHGVRADIGALVALDTVLDLPLGNVHGDAALLVGGRAVLPRTVLTARESRYGQVVALQGR